MSLLSSEVIRLHLELSVESLLNHSCFLLLPLGVELIESSSHLLSYLLGGLHVGKEFLLELLVFVGKDCSKLSTTGDEVGGGPLLDISNSIPSNLLNNDVIGLVLPPSLEQVVLVTFDLVL